MNHDFFGKVESGGTTELSYQGRSIQVHFWSLNDNQESMENLDKLASHLKELGDLDKKAQYYLVKSIKHDGNFISHFFNSVVEDGIKPDTLLYKLYDKYEHDASEMSAEEFVSTLILTDINLYVDDPENEIYKYEDGGILNYCFDPNSSNDDINIALQYTIDGNEMILGDWELLVMFNREGQCVQCYFNKMY